MYIVVSVGNTDNKLTQDEWSQYVEEVDEILRANGKIHFFGGAPNWMPWQNTAWIADILAENSSTVMSRLNAARIFHKQRSLFFMVGTPDFI